ncbi:helix-turn-helix domain-containing protein, partial [Pseudomonas sp. BGM005]|nr:helix-turn-helix domain-containing protein [Pseudomonas sp. BG5]
MAGTQDEERLVGADRVLAVMIALSEHPTGATLEEVAHSVGATKSTVHRALATLRRSGLATQLSRGVYILGDEFYRIAFRSYSLRPEGALIQPALDELARRFGETVHFA